MIDLLRWVTVVVWGGVAAYLSPWIPRALRRQSRPHDPFWALFWFLGLNRVNYGLQGLYGTSFPAGLALCNIFGLIGGVLVVLLRRAYGADRG